MTFPADFVWGAATSAYQIEGAVDADGRGESIWDRFSHTPAKVKNGDTGDVACDHYNRVEEDLELMSSLGLQAYRFSVAWPRVQPDGTGPANEAGLDFYRRLVDGLRARGIRPFATLYHWDLPQALEDRGGWRSRDTAERFADYAELVFEALGDGVEAWITHNEPAVAAYVGHGRGRHAPGLRDWAAAVRVAHHLLLSHGLALRRFRGSAPIGITFDLSPAWGDDEAAVTLWDGFRNRWFLDAVLRGAYPADLAAVFERRLGPLDAIEPGDLELISAPVDFVGVNYYTPNRVRSNEAVDPVGVEVLPPEPPVTAMSWEVAPGGFRELLVRLQRDYGVPLYVTENGAAFDDPAPTGSVVEDPDRVAYLEGHVDALARALADGVDVRGYFVWSLLDNFEWAEAYSKRFGIVQVDFDTQQRTPKRSGLWYRELIG
jgi:beta-glucosidase